jgi:hypothetical protein
MQKLNVMLPPLVCASELIARGFDLNGSAANDETAHTWRDAA